MSRNFTQSKIYFSSDYLNASAWTQICNKWTIDDKVQMLAIVSDDKLKTLDYDTTCIMVNLVNSRNGLGETGINK